MKKKHILLGAFLVIMALLLWFRSHWPVIPAPHQSEVIETSQTNRSSASSAARLPNAVPVVADTSGPSPESNFTAGNEKRLKQMAEDMENSKNEWRTPIEFYGKVVDENTNPVTGAEIHFIWTDLSAEGNSEKQTTSDDNGLFSLRDTTGKNLHVEVSKLGYYSYAPSGLYFNYAGEAQNFMPDVANPVVFRLKKKSMADRLIHVHAGMGGLEGIQIPRNGTPVEVSLTTGDQTAEGQGDLRVRCWTNDQGIKPGQDYDWKCQITVLGGGLLQRTDDLDFQAPPDGYQPSDVIDMPASLGNQWARNGKRNYFVRLANGNYARISFEMIAGGAHFFQLESFLNPNGSRNLEFDPNSAVSGGN